jgi:hypothetical protein
LLTWGLLALLPGCYPFEQEHVRPDVELFSRDEIPPRESSPYHPRPDPPVPRISAEQEAIDPRLTIVERLPSPDPAFPPLLPEPAFPVSTAQSTPPADPALVAAVRSYLAGDLEGARKNLGNSRSEMTIGTQEELLGLLARLQDRDLEQLPTEEAGVMLARVEQLMRTVQARAPLLLDQVCFCRRIKTFGVYDPLPGQPEFQAGIQGQPGERVCVYAEVRNVLTSKSGSWYVLALDGSLEIRHEGRVVFRTDFPAVPDRSRSPRSDCFVGYEFNIPPGLPPGWYDLRVQVRDLASRQPRLAHKALHFQVVQPVALDSH